LSIPLQEDVPTEAELRVVHAQLAGWLEGLVQGIQAMAFAHHMDNVTRLRQVRNGSAPGDAGGACHPEPASVGSRPELYL
jgi:hypothetical protein